MKASHFTSARRFVVVATGARTPVGLRATTSAAAVRAGICRHGLHPTLRDGAGSPLRFALDGRLDPDLRGIARAQILAVSALKECLEPLASLGPLPLSLWVGVPEDRPGWSRADADLLMYTLTRELGRHARFEDVMSVPLGHAAGFVALTLALRELDTGRTHACVIGGTDTWLHPAALDWLDDAARLCTARSRAGFVPGEAAGFFVVTTEATARAWGLPARAAIRGAATSVEPNPRGSGRPCTGEALAFAIAEATSSLELPRERVATTYCDLNGERWRTDEFLHVPLRLPAPFVDANHYDAPAYAWGDVGAASAPLYVCLAVASAERGYARGPHVLAWTASVGGTRAAVSLTLPERHQG